ncbi:GmrSD restriction endonuclease domain-containing protein [Hyphobacterium sp.]|uniref:GmrSD restriction endonuclease domain-containing protein n=1 Tax=Hyphobacterium sp. TaxID=2004662 RepID=UPI003BAD0105
MSTVYRKVDPTLRGLIDQIESGDIGLPDLQRPFVWPNVKVRNLFDSMYRGFPVGYLLFWEPAEVTSSKAIGEDAKQRPARLLIVDGQQRLTSLYAVMTGTSVIRKNYKAENIEIAFDPLNEKFEVADAAIRRDPRYIPNISILWAPDANIFELAGDHIEKLNSVQELSPVEKKRIQDSIMRLSQLDKYPFTALELSASVDEEAVSDVFVRINSEGKKLNQADFILTLMSVFWDKGRAELEKFCAAARQPSTSGPSPYNAFIEPDPDQLLRVCVGVAFRRARLKSVYSLLRGKNVATDEFDRDASEQQFDILKEAQAKVLNLQYWHDFLKAVREAGFRSAKMITSKNSLIFAYILYLIGKTEFRVDERELRKLIAAWFFMSSLTARYSSSPESQMESDLARLRQVETAEQFAAFVESVFRVTLTGDFFTTNLPSDLATSSSRSPSQYAYFASLNILDATALYSDQKTSDLFDAGVKAPRAASELHHLFPKDYLDSIGITDNREKNQIANFAIVEWHDNSGMGNKAPSDYAPKFEDSIESKKLQQMYYWHALPDGWFRMDYQSFLQKRRELIAEVIRDAFNKLRGGESLSDETRTTEELAELISDGETSTTEFKSTLRVNLHTNENDQRMELGVLKTIAGFINSRGGGSLVIGVADDGSPVGIDADKFPNEDKMYLHLINLIRDRIGADYMLYIHPRFDDYEDTRVLCVDCDPGRSPVYVKDGKEHRFYVRTGAATAELSGREAQEFIRQRFSGGA